MPPKVSAERLVALVCVSQVLVQIGASFLARPAAWHDDAVGFD